MKTQTLKILAIGDVIGEKGCFFLRKVLPRLRAEEGAELVIVNGENSARTNGIDLGSAQLLFEAGADVITTGNHVFRRREVYDYLDGAASLLRPSNFPGECPGRGSCIQTFGGYRVLIVNLLGTLFMDSLASPFETMDKILKAEAGRFDFAVVDFHAEATSEKLSFAHDFDSRVAVVFGTHTHVPTADLGILPGGTGYITDLGMCGPSDSVLGMKKEIAIARFRTHMPSRFEVASGNCLLTGAVFEVNEEGKTVSTKFIRVDETERV